MALFTDGPPSMMEDLTGQDTQLPDVAHVEGIDVTRKLSLAQDQLAIEIRVLLDRFRPGPDLAKVVVTEPLKLWHTYWTLEMVYADAYYNSLNDRYSNKRDEFRVLAKWFFDKLIETGVGIVSDPVPKAAAFTLAPAAAFLAAGSYFVTMTWTNRAGQEGVPANLDTISFTSGSFSVTPGAAPQNATGWNLYAGTAPETMVLQNDAPLAPAQVWIQSTAVRTTGRSPGTGQSPDYFQPVPRVIPRG